MKLGIVGLPNVGKSTLFNALTGSGVAAANYPFCTIDPNIGAVSVPDKRLDFLKAMFDPNKYTPAVIEFVDIAGLVKGASKGEGLGNRFLSHIREVDAIVHVVRCFEDDDVIHVDGVVGPRKDVEVIDLELIFADLEILDRRLEKTAKLARVDRKLVAEAELLRRLHDFLADGNPARAFDCTDDERALLLQSPLLSAKPVLYAANLSEDDFMGGLDANPHYAELRAIAEDHGAPILPICAKIEADISDMSSEDKGMFLSELSLEESGLDRLIRASYALLGLISFLTCGKDEVRAWPIPLGTKAPRAAGTIHSDFERGFIRAEIVSFADLEACGSFAAAKERGLYRSEGKDYLMRDGDVTLFRFNV